MTARIIRTAAEFHATDNDHPRGGCCRDPPRTLRERRLRSAPLRAPHVDQGLSCTLFFKDTATTLDVNRAQMYARRKGLKSLYYIRIRQQDLAGTELEGRVARAL